MYILTPESKQKIQEYSISGTVGSESITKDNILLDSLNINNQCADSSEFRLGGAYIGEMNVTFVNVDIPRNDWVGKEIKLTIRIGQKLIPTGVYTIDEANHLKEIVEVVAYDNMAKFDKTVGVSEGAYGSIFDFLTLACNHCGVSLGMTQAQVEALPNGTEPFVLNELGDIETWRDLIYWCAVSCCSIATLDRHGNLVLKTFHQTVDDTIDYDVRYVGSEYGDEIITYTGAAIGVTEEQIVEYYHAQVDDGYTLNIGQNPFFQVPQAQRQIYMENIVAALANVSYNACNVTIPFGFQYDLTDVLKFTNGQGSSTNLFCVMGYSFDFYGDCLLTGIPAQKNSKSKSDKNIQGLISTISKNEFTSYEQKNTSAITIAENTTERLILSRIASNTNTKAQIHVEVNLESVANVASKTYTDPIDLADIFADVSDAGVVGQVSYLINSEDALYYPEETWIDGKHVLHLMYILPLAANTLSQFEVYMKALKGTIKIGVGDVWLYASGAGLVGDGKWNGAIDCKDTATLITLVENTFKDATDSVSVSPQTPTGDSVTDTASVWNLVDITIANATDSVSATVKTPSYRRVLEDGSVRITEDNNTRITEGD